MRCRTAIYITGSIWKKMYLGLTLIKLQIFYKIFESRMGKEIHNAFYEDKINIITLNILPILYTETKLEIWLEYAQITF